MTRTPLWLLSFFLMAPTAPATVLNGKMATRTPAGKGPVYWDTARFTPKGNKLAPRKPHTRQFSFLHPDDCDEISIQWRGLDGLAVAKAPGFRGTCAELTALKAPFDVEMAVAPMVRGYLVADVTVKSAGRLRSTTLILPFEATDYRFKPKPITVDRFGNRFQDEKIN